MIGPVPGTNLIENSISLSGGNSGMSSRKTSGYSLTTGILLNLCSLLSTLPEKRIYPQLLVILRGFIYRLIKVTGLKGEVKGNTIDLSEQFNTTWLAESQSIPKIKSKPKRGRQIKLAIKTLSSIQNEHLIQT